MCGILGTTKSIAEQQFAEALHMLAHRGPDGTGTFRDDRICLGHQRLAIQDLSPNGHQPMSILNGQIWIVFNGEIYNHFDVRRDLGNEFNFRSTSDTETILYGYLKYGKAVVHRLNGIFAFAIYDQRVNELFIARDPLGVKPLYYYEDEHQFAFASEIKAITQLPGVDLSVAPAAFVNYLQFLWSPGSATPFSRVKKLEPGHYLCRKLDNQPSNRFTKYYEIPFTGELSQQSEAELTDQLDACLKVAVKRQLLSDVPVGFFLSGGLDSSLIAAIAKQQLGSGFNCYTIEIPGKDSVDGFADDLGYAQTVARHLDTNLITVRSDADIVRDFDAMIWHLDEPQADPAPLHVLNICDAARKNGDIVLLGGTAGDDLFSGYRRHQALNLEKFLRLMPASLGKLIDRGLAQCSSRLPVVRRLQKITRGLGLSRLQRMAGYYAWIGLDRNKSLFHPDVASQIAKCNPTQTLLDSLQAIPNEKNSLNRMLFWDMKFFLADHNLNYTDKMSMARGVEVRVPFLDLELVEFACRLPIHLKMRGNQTKYLLRKVAERYLPKDVIYRPKTGFGAPVRRWIGEGKLDAQLQRLLSSDDSRFSEYFSREAVGNLILDSKAGRMDGSYTIWTLLAIDSWLRQFAR